MTVLAWVGLAMAAPPGGFRVGSGVPVDGAALFVPTVVDVAGGWGLQPTAAARVALDSFSCPPWPWRPCAGARSGP